MRLTAAILWLSFAAVLEERLACDSKSKSNGNGTNAAGDDTKMIQRDQIPLHLKLFHGLGAIAYGVKDNGFSVFLLTFYNQVLGLDAAMVGGVIMVALFADAFVDLIIGELGDRTQTRWGRRLPWLYTAALPLGLAWLALWNPPQVSDTLLLTWLFVFAIIVRALVSACEVPSFALVPELTGDYHERTQLVRFRFLFAWAGGLVIAVIAYGLIFSGEGAVTKPGGYPAYALLCAILITGSVLISALGQHKYIAHPSPPRSADTGTPTDIFREMRHSLSNRAFLILLTAAVFVFISQAITFSMINYVMVFVWRLDQAGLTLYGLSLFVSLIVAFTLVTPMSKYFGKKGAAIVACAISAGLFAALYSAWLWQIFPGAPAAPHIWSLFAIMIFISGFAIIPMMLNGSMMADVVEASQAETGRRSEGLFFAGYFFMQKFALGIGIFISGNILSIIGFPAQAKAGEVTMPILQNLAIALALINIFLAVSYMILVRRFPITKQDHDERRASLAGIGGNSIVD